MVFIENYGQYINEYSYTARMKANRSVRKVTETGREKRDTRISRENPG